MNNKTRNSQIKLHYLGLSLIFVLTTLMACTTTKRIPVEVVSEIDARISKMTEQSSFSGSILIAQDDQVLLSKGYGQADIESGEPITPQTRFRIYSVTKGFTAAAILILQDQGRLKVQDRLCEYIADCPAAWQEITIHHLLTHTSGISDRIFFEKIAGRQEEQFTPAELIALFKDAPLDFQPGQEWRYSNPGYILLGYIIEQVSGQTYEEYLQEHIFSPLNLLNTGYDHMENGIATGYSSFGYEARTIDTSHPYSAGGLYSTVEDLYHWIQAFQTDQYFSKKTFDPQFTPLVPAPSEEHFSEDMSYGYGWMIGERLGHLLVGHTGSYYGFCSFLEYYPDEKVSIIVLSNLECWNSLSAFTLPSEIIFKGK